ncbi:hypothetical protein HB991_18615 [Yersinia mollaretii]|uniref:Uncharacterized protein n=1 Tax=Yersinia mollaretii TaxID=33060 RepID=A0AA44CPI7_YERMO|nr:hypothetical protein [Yersinia mollaretii]NIL24513.1 hypothetical protein [Yersinia mollaretii]CNJ54239.1 Uncharacterised protein [Yersinia mollaretii]CQR16387.1 Uncharacterised protein [Yersinia mollaretii]
MNNILTPRHQEIIANLCGSDNSTVVSKIIDNLLTPNEIEDLCSLISNEFMLNGITEDFEPTKYGKELEELLDIVNRNRLK